MSSSRTCQSNNEHTTLAPDQDLPYATLHHALGHVLIYLDVLRMRSLGHVSDILDSLALRIDIHILNCYTPMLIIVKMFIQMDQANSALDLSRFICDFVSIKSSQYHEI